MPGTHRFYEWRERLVVLIIVASALAVWRPLFDNFSLAKVSLVWLSAVGAVGITGVRWLLDGEIRLRRSPFVVVVACLAAGLLVSVVTSSAPSTSVVGVYTRWTGLASYTAYLVLALVASRHANHSFAERLVRALMYVGLAVSVYALVQASGRDPFEWRTDGLSPVFSTFGNINFASAFLALTLAPALWSAARPSASRGHRWLGSSALVLGFVALLAIGSRQGFIVAIAALVPLGLGLAIERSPRLAEAFRLRWVLALSLASGAAGLAVLLANWGVLSGRLGIGFRERLFFYDAAVAMFADHPVTGTGLSTFSRHFTQYQPVAHALEYQESVPDAPHSVPLAMFAEGGLVLGLAYLAAVFLVGWRLVQGLRNREVGDGRLLLLTLGGVWFGYQLQSAISIDEPPLAVVHWVSAGAIVGLVESPVEWTRRLPWGPVTTRKGRKRPRASSPPLFAKAAAGLVAVCAALACWVGLRPARADLAAARGRGYGALAIDDTRATGPAEDAFARAHELAPHNATYWFEHARLRHARGDVEGALQAQERSAYLDPGQPLYAANAAFYALQAGDQQAAREWWNEAVARDPNNPNRMTAAAAFFESLGDVEKANDLRRQADSLLAGRRA